MNKVDNINCGQVWTQQSPQPGQNLDQLSHFHTAHGHDQQTEHATTVTIAVQLNNYNKGTTYVGTSYGPVSVSLCLSFTRRCSIETAEQIGLVFGTGASFNLSYSV